MSTAVSQADRVVFLRVGWSAYEALLDGVQDAAGHRIAYDGEVLEIMSPSADHERYNRLLERLIGFLASEWKRSIESFGSTTLRVKPRGAEPDSAFYIEKAEAVIGKQRIDLEVDPPPDLAVEVDISRERIDKQGIYAALNIAEFWRYDGVQLRAYTLGNGRYEEIRESVVLNGLPIVTIGQFLEMRTSHGFTEICNQWQEWLRSHRPGGRLRQ